MSASTDPKCEICGKPAACYGAYDVDAAADPPRQSYHCDTCCGHSNEDGHCTPLYTGYTRAQYAVAVDEAHSFLHHAQASWTRDPTEALASVQKAHEHLHDVGGGMQRVGCATAEPEVQRLVSEWQAKLDGTGLPCGHRLADLIGGKGAVTKCGACLAEKQKPAAGAHR